MTYDITRNLFNYFKENNLTHFFNKYAKNLFDLVIYRDLNYVTIWTNKEQYLLRKYKITKDKLYSKPCFNILYNKEEPCEDCPIKEVQETNASVEKEIEYKGSFFMIRVYPVENDNNKLIGFMLNKIDITRAKYLEKKYKKEKLINNKLINLSHEFRTPLSLMHTSLQMAKKRFENVNLKDEEQEKFNIYMNTIQKNNYRLLKLVNNLLDFHKIDDNKYNMHFQNRDIVDTVKKITLSSMRHEKAEHKTIKFNSEIKEKIIAFDPFEIERVIINLIANALKFTAFEDNINVNVKEEKNNVLISIKDTGMGIPEDKQELIFERFDQADNSLSRPNEGSGLGLPIAEEIIELHDGEIALESKVGEGSEFIIKLPIRKVSEQEIKKCNKKSDSMVERLDVEFSDIYQ